MADVAQRKPNGTFAIGYSGGPGRPRRETERVYLDATIASVSVEEWMVVVRRALEDAQQGDGVARAWLGKHLIGDDPAALLAVAIGDSDGSLYERLAKLAAIGNAIRARAAGSDSSGAPAPMVPVAGTADASSGQ